MVHPSAEIEAVVICHDEPRMKRIESLTESIKGMTRTKKLEIVREGTRPKGAAAHIFTDIEIFVPLAGLVDVDKEIAKLTREQEKIENQLQKTEAKLANEKFMANAPDDVVAKERDKQETMRAQLAKIAENISRLRELA